MSNLVSNAVRYTPGGGRIDGELARAARRPRRVLGARHRPGHRGRAHLPRLTERFYRVDRSRSRETGGTGLGLAIVKHVVQRHGGELRIESTPGAGSTFAIAVPGQRACAPVRPPPAAAPHRPPQQRR